MGVLEGCDRFLKYIFFFFTFVLFLLGCVAIGIGAWASIDKGFTTLIGANVPGVDAHALKQAAVLLIIVGIGIMLVGFLGCCGAMKENTCFLGLFSVCLFLVFVLMIAGAVMAANYQPILKKLLKTGLETLKKDYDPSKPNATSTAALNSIQHDFKCCVFHAPNETVPASCYENGKKPTSAPPVVATTGAPPVVVTTAAPPVVATTKAPPPVAATTEAATESPTVAATNGTVVRARREAAADVVGPYTADCADAIMVKLKGALDRYKIKIGGIGVASAIIVVMGMVVSMALCCKIRRGYVPA